MAGGKYYVVWAGHEPGVYDSWDDAEEQVKGYAGASYRAFKTQAEAVAAYREGFDREGLLQDVARQVKKMSDQGTEVHWTAPSPSPRPAAAATVVNRTRAIAVDAACSGNPGPMEYQGVLLPSGQRLFHVGPMAGGTNNIGEFLAIVHALALQDKQGTRLPIYSDSRNAQLWVRGGQCKTKLVETADNAPIFELIDRAEQWLASHSIAVPILKWDTKAWGEIPADFGRK